MENKNQYVVGTFRLWLNEKGGLQLKLNGDAELYYIPKSTKLYDRLMADHFEGEQK